MPVVPAWIRLVLTAVATVIGIALPLTGWLSREQAQVAILAAVLVIALVAAYTFWLFLLHADRQIGKRRAAPSTEQLAETRRQVADEWERFNGFLMYPKSVHESPGNPVLAYVDVEAVAGDQAKSARARLIAVSKLDGPRFQRLDIPLAWAQPDNPADPSRKTFHGTARLNVATGTHNPNIMIPAAAFPLDIVDQRRSEMPKGTDLLIGVEVTAENKSRTTGWFRLKWWSEVVLPPDEDGGPSRVWILNYAQIEFENAPNEQTPAG